MFQVFRVQVNPRFVDVQNLNQYASELRNISPVTAESLTPQVQDINERWGTLLSASQDREVLVISCIFNIIHWQNYLDYL